MKNEIDKLSNIQNTVNTKVYHGKDIGRHYRSDLLVRAEVSALLKYQWAFAGRDVLDIGVGTGRTSIYLSPLARHYEGIDYSPVMVSLAQARLPNVPIYQADMRNLSIYCQDSYDFVFAPNNVFDAVSDSERKQTLREAHRVMRPGGIMMFSSHNRSYRHALSGPHLSYSRNPLTQTLLAVKLLRQYYNHLRLRKARFYEGPYALLNDEGHDYACLHYYIDRQAQAKQLDEAGFDLIEVFDAQGASLETDDLGLDSPWLIYVARVKMH